MKKIVLSLVIAVMMAPGFTQKATVVSAYNYHNSGRLDKAKEAIDKAITHERTMSDAKTWFYRGNIYIDIARSLIEEYQSLDADALNKAYEAYQKAIELDERNRYTDDIRNFMPIVGEAFFNQGAEQFNNGLSAMEEGKSDEAKMSFSNSASSFEKAFDIYGEAGATDTTAIYFIGLAAEMAEEWDKARSSFETLVEMNYQESGIYSSLGNIYLNVDKNLNNAIEIFKIGRTRFPDDFNLLINETNLFLGADMTEEALNNLTKAAEIDTTNANIFFAIGAKYNELADDTTRTEETRQDAFEKAVIAYNKATDLDPDYFDPNYNMGALYVNKAAQYISIANDLPLSEMKKYEELKKKSDSYLELSVPYLERANRIDPSDLQTLVTLKEIYTRQGKPEKVKEIDKKIEDR